jgi:threonine dehydrogenase-like Zn-dependent dehydrogenase
MTAPFAMAVDEWPRPEVGAGDVLVEVGAAGICAGDLYHYTGRNPYAPYPQVCGHEIAGTVAELGAGVAGLGVGSRVVVEPYVGCGACYPCRIGKYNCCARLEVIGVHRPGGYADSVVAPATHVHPYPEGLTPFLASFAEPLAIAVHACNRAALEPGELALVLGCGPIGLAVIEVARERGADVIASDPVESRRETARALGADAVDAGDELLARVAERTGGEGMPAVIEATGVPEVIGSTVQLVAAGGRIVVVGLVKQGVDVRLPGLDLTRKEVTLLGSRAGLNAFPEALRLLASGAIRYPESATTFGLWDAPAVFAELARDPTRVQKAVLVRE